VDFEGDDEQEDDISSGRYEEHRQNNPVSLYPASLSQFCRLLSLSQYLTRRFASTEMDILGSISRRQAEVSAMLSQDSEESFLTDPESTGNKSMKDKFEVSAAVVQPESC
jgi:hypothetical protein